jgi:hypothetical protein
MAVVLPLIIAVGAQADVIVKTKSSGKMMGMMEMEMTGTEYVRGDRSASEDITRMTGGMVAMFGGDEATEVRDLQIYRLDLGLSWDIDLDNKSYKETPLEVYREIMEGQAEQGDDDMLGEAEKYEWTVDIKTEDKPVNINGFSCKGIIASAKGVSKENPEEKTDLHFEYWYAEDVKGYDELNEYRKSFAEATGVDVVASQEGVGSMFAKFDEQFEQMFAKMHETEGYPIKTIINIKGSGGQMPGMGETQMDEESMPPEMMEMMKGLMGGEESEDGMTTVFSLTTIVESIEENPVEDSKFEIPEGFTKSEY